MVGVVADGHLSVCSASGAAVPASGGCRRLCRGAYAYGFDLGNGCGHPVPLT